MKMHPPDMTFPLEEHEGNARRAMQRIFRRIHECAFQHREIAAGKDALQIDGHASAQIAVYFGCEMRVPQHLIST